MQNSHPKRPRHYAADILQRPRREWARLLDDVPEQLRAMTREHLSDWEAKRKALKRK